MIRSHEKKTRILLIDDHSIFQFGVRMLIDQHRGLQIVGVADSSELALDIAVREQPDVIVLDLDLNGESGLELIPRLQAAAPDSRVLVLTGLTDAEQHVHAVQQGAVGLVQKRQDINILLQAIDRVAAGEAWLDPSMVANALVRMSRARGAKQEDPEAHRIAALTEREREVVVLIGEGLQNRSIAHELSITETTVRHHLTSIFAKLGVTNRLELVIYAYRNHLANIHTERTI